MIKYLEELFEAFKVSLLPEWLNGEYSEINLVEPPKIMPFFNSKNKFAILIGIDYLNDKNARLDGCVSDAYNLKKVLIEKFGFEKKNILMIVDDPKNKIKPTKANIINQLKNLVNKTKNLKDSSIFISYSGHGAQIRDRNNDEKDGKDEVWIPLDYRKGIITDDQFRSVFLNQLKGNANCVILSDSCHSGTYCDCCFQYDNNKNYVQINKLLPNKNANVLVISGCRDHQTAQEVSVDGLIQGAMTYSFIQSCSKEKDFEGLVRDMNGVCRRLKLQQIPTLTTSNKTCAKLNVC